MADALRWLAIGLFSVTGGWAVVVMMEARRFRPPSGYVRAIVASYLTLLTGWAWELHAHLGQPIAGIRLVFALIAGVLGVVAMGSLYAHYRFEQRRLRHQRKSDRIARELLAEAKRRQQEGS